MSTIGDTDGTKAALRAAPIEAERECQQSRADDYVARIIRDTRIVRAHCGGMSQKEISVVGPHSSRAVSTYAECVGAYRSPTTRLGAKTSAR